MPLESRNETCLRSTFTVTVVPLTVQIGTRDPHPPTNNGGMKEIDDYSEPIARMQCEGYTAKTNGKTNCYWVTTVKPFEVFIEAFLLPGRVGRLKPKPS